MILGGHLGYLGTVDKAGIHNRIMQTSDWSHCFYECGQAKTSAVEQMALQEMKVLSAAQIREGE